MVQTTQCYILYSHTVNLQVRRNKINISDTIPSKNYSEMFIVSFQSSILTSKAKTQRSNVYSVHT